LTAISLWRVSQWLFSEHIKILQNKRKWIYIALLLPRSQVWITQFYLQNYTILYLPLPRRHDCSSGHVIAAYY